ncbi:MAG TPA: carboxypeptidase regulatory-like domain-containing protein, partial [Longimicrobiaceae bacterium]|nr:carboxypeptidase regulatory-like domain-containing protein [Longimicrobiaceae bacterium]
MRLHTRFGQVLALAAAVAMLGAAAAPLAAQTTGSVSGRVTESGSQRPLNGAQVTVVGASRRAVTDATGAYTIANVPAGPARVRAELI